MLYSFHIQHSFRSYRNLVLYLYIALWEIKNSCKIAFSWAPIPPSRKGRGCRYYVITAGPTYTWYAPSWVSSPIRISLCRSMPGWVKSGVKSAGAVLNSGGYKKRRRSFRLNLSWCAIPDFFHTPYLPCIPLTPIGSGIPFKFLGNFWRPTWSFRWVGFILFWPSGASQSCNNLDCLGIKLRLLGLCLFLIFFLLDVIC